MKSKIISIHEDLRNKKYSHEDLLKKTGELAKENQKNCNSFVTLLETKNYLTEFSNLLSGIPYGLKDNFSTKDILTTANSNTLKNYIPVFSSTVYEKLNQNGAILIGKTTLDEFGMGGSGTTGHTGIVKNPWDSKRQAGGSSAGSAASVAAGVYPFAIGSDTGDSVRKPAAYCGIVGYKPTYGLISRYGLIPYASSLDHVGVLTNSVFDAAIVVDAIKGKDKYDMTSFDSNKIHLVNYLEEKKSSIEPKKLFYIKEIANLSEYKNPSDDLIETLNNFKKNIEEIKKIGYTVEEVSMDSLLLSVIPSTYDCISYAEATSNMSNMTGIPFGVSGDGDSVNEQMKSFRTKGFSSLIKRRFVIGSFVLQKENQAKYFENAQKVRRILVNQLNEFFKQYDALILPCSGGPAKYLDETKNTQTEDQTVLENHLVLANFGGFPSITIPSGIIRHLPIGINLTGKIYDDENILEIASKIEDIFAYSNELLGGNL